MIIKPGEKIHVIHRQLFNGDVRRHFVGVIDACDGNLARVTGYVFATDPKSNQFVKRDTPRTRLLSLDSANLIINILPERVKIENIAYKYRPGADTLVTDGTDWHLDLTHL